MGHDTGVPAQAPPLHVSPVVHASKSSQAAELFVYSHVPMLQMSSVHGLESSHSPLFMHWEISASRTVIREKSELVRD